MLHEPKHNDRIDGLAEQLQFAPTITPISSIGLSLTLSPGFRC